MKANSLKKNFQDILIIGAGAAGLFCAAQLAKAKGKITILERSKTAGQKLSSSGGGHCNFTNITLDPDKYVSLDCRNLADFVTPAFAYTPPEKILTLFKKWRLPYEERPNGRYFLKCRAQKLTECLQANAANSQIVLNSQVTAINFNSGASNFYNFEVTVKNYERQKTEKYYSKKLFAALGTPACPGLGGINSWKIMACSGHTFAPPVPALCPYLYDSPALLDHFGNLSGISAPVALSFYPFNSRKPKVWRGNLLFTHKGLSGPAVLQSSLYWEGGVSSELIADFLPGKSYEEILDDPENRRKTARSCLTRFLPDKLADALLSYNFDKNIAQIKTSQLSRSHRNNLHRQVHSFKFGRLKLAGFKIAEVCRGGFNLAQINPETMESRLIPNLYLGGEMLDLTGRLGGFNLHWAWASAALAAKAMRTR